MLAIGIIVVAILAIWVYYPASQSDVPAEVPEVPKEDVISPAVISVPGEPDMSVDMTVEAPLPDYTQYFSATETPGNYQGNNIQCGGYSHLSTNQFAKLCYENPDCKIYTLNPEGRPHCLKNALGEFGRNQLDVQYANFVRK